MKRYFSLFSPKTNNKPDQSSSSSNASRLIMKLGIVIVMLANILIIFRSYWVGINDGIIIGEVGAFYKLKAIVQYWRINPHLTESEREERLDILNKQLTQMGIDLKIFDEPNAPISASAKKLFDKYKYVEATEEKESIQASSQHTKSNDDDDNNDSWSTKNK